MKKLIKNPTESVPMIHQCFYFYRSLSCDRLKVHKNFMLALMIRYAVSVIYYEPYIYGKSSPVVWFRNIGQVRK